MLLLASACSFDQAGVPGSSDGGILPTADASAVDATISVDASVPDASTNRTDAAIADAAIPDANLPDAVPPDAMCTDTVVTPSNFSACDVPMPTSGLHVNGWFWWVDTDTGMIYDHNDNPVSLPTAVVTQSNGPEILIVAVSSLQIDTGAALAAYGQRPLALVVTGNATIDPATEQWSQPGLLYVGATLEESGAGGGILADCLAGEGYSGVTQSAGGESGGSGGSGGGFGQAGGTGARVAGSGGSVTQEGEVEGNASITPLRGGCRGGDGGNSGGLGGGGGGAIQLVVGGTLTVNGTITARGGGGLGALGSNQGGGGGGSGGAILIEATNLVVTGTITANGGGGGEGTKCGNGCENATGTDGQNGYMYSETPALGGANPPSNSGGGNGGNGGVRTVGAGNGLVGGIVAAGGGGGGGGVGRIRFNTVTQPNINIGAVISPAAQ